MGACLVRAPREAQGCLVTEQVAAFQLRSRALALRGRASEPPAPALEAPALGEPPEAAGARSRSLLLLLPV